MIPKGLFTQIGMVIVAVAIIVTYVQPAFVGIGTVQDSIAVYKEERKKVDSVNQRLDSLVETLDSVSASDHAKLRTFLPDKIDEIAIQRDLLLISQAAGVFYKNSSYGGASDKKQTKEDTLTESFPRAHSFSLSVEGTYGQVKNLFNMMQQNDYPLEINSATIKRVGEGDFLSVDIVFDTYTYKASEGNEELKF